MIPSLFSYQIKSFVFLSPTPLVHNYHYLEGFLYGSINSQIHFAVSIFSGKSTCSSSTTVLTSYQGGIWHVCCFPSIISVKKKYSTQGTDTFNQVTSIKSSLTRNVPRSAPLKKSPNYGSSIATPSRDHRQQGTSESSYSSSASLHAKKHSSNGSMLDVYLVSAEAHKQRVVGISGEATRRSSLNSAFVQAEVIELV